MSTDLSLKGLFKGNNGKWSMMRVLSFIVVLGALPLCYLIPEQSAQWVAIIGFGMAGKWLSKKNEAQK